MFAFECRERDGEDGPWDLAGARTGNREIAPGQADLFQWRAKGAGDAYGSGDRGDTLRYVWAAAGDERIGNRIRGGNGGSGRAAKCFADYGWRSGGKAGCGI